MLVEFDTVDMDLYGYHWETDGPYARLSHPTRYAHRIVAERMLGRSLLPNEKVDHIHGNTMDNRRSQLRITTSAGNSQNKIRLMRTNKSGFRGVRWNAATKSWRAYVAHMGKFHHCGLFGTPEEAASAAQRKREELGFLGGASL